MLTSVSFLLLLFCSFFSFGQRLDYLAEVFNGKIKSVTTISPIDMGRTTIYYDEHKQPTIIYQHNYKNELTDSIAVFYNQKGLIDSLFCVSLPKQEFKIITCAYDQNGNRITENFYDVMNELERQYRYTFDPINHTITFTACRYNTYGGELCNHQAVFDETKKTTITFTISRDKTIPEYKIKHDKHGNKIEYATYVEDSLFELELKATYNAKQHLIKLKAFQVIEEGDFEVKKFRYKYDRHKNWLSKTEVVKGTNKAITTRNITYYD